VYAGYAYSDMFPDTKGVFLHEDFVGHKGTIAAGDLQVILMCLNSTLTLASYAELLRICSLIYVRSG